MADVSQIKLPNGSVYDLIDEKSGYITAEYIENKTDYEIPVSRVGEIVVGETAIGTDSTNFPTSKAVVDYVDERVVQEMDAIDVGVTSVNGKTGSVTLSASDVGALSSSTYIPQYTSDLTNDSGFITASDVPTPDLSSYMRIGVDYVTAGQISTMPVGNNATSDGVSTNAVGVGSHAEGYYTTVSTNGRYGHAEGYHTVVGGKYAHAAGYYTTANSESQYVFGTYNILDSGVMGSKGTYVEIVGNGTSTTNRSNARTLDWNGNEILAGKLTVGAGPTANMDVATKQYVDNSIPTIPTNISSFTNDSGYLTASDIASVMTYKGTKANYAALPSTGNTTGDVWHLTDTGAEWAWDGSAWQELGTAIDLSGYATKATTLAGYGITDAKIQNGTITLGSNTITPLTSFTETDPIFSASAASGITATDISNWNAKVSDDKTWNGVVLNKAYMNNKSSTIVPIFESGAAYYYVATATPSGGKVVLYDKDACLNSTTPSANDNSTKVATTAYVDAAIPDTSSFSTTDEKVKIDSVITGIKYYPIVATDSTAAATRQYDKDGFIYDVYRNASTTGTGILTLGNNKVSGTSGNVQGKLILFGSTAYSHRIEGAPTADRILTLPNNNGTIALTSDIPKVYSSTNTGGYLTMATLPIYDGTVE